MLRRRRVSTSSGKKSVSHNHISLKRAYRVTRNLYITVILFPVPSSQKQLQAKINKNPRIFRNENSAQRGSFRPDIPADIPPKTSVRPSKSWKIKHFGTDIPCGRPRKNFGLKNFGLIFRSLDLGFQRAANGGSDPSWLNLAFLGRPDFPSRGPQIPIFKGFWGLWTENRGAPKTPNSTTTDLTPHLRPSEDFLSIELRKRKRKKISRI